MTITTMLCGKKGATVHLGECRPNGRPYPWDDLIGHPVCGDRHYVSEIDCAPGEVDRLCGRCVNILGASVARAIVSARLERSARDWAAYERRIRATGLPPESYDSDREAGQE